MSFLGAMRSANLTFLVTFLVLRYMICLGLEALLVKMVIYRAIDYTLEWASMKIRGYFVCARNYI